MTELEFINTQPSSYGGAANANLLISSSVVNPGVDNTPQAPYAIIGISIPFQDDQNTKLESALKEVTELRFDFTEGIIRPKVLERQRRNGFFYFHFISYITFYRMKIFNIIFINNFIFCICKLFIIA